MQLFDKVEVLAYYDIAVRSARYASFTRLSRSAR
jgi:hypothetical protein